MRAPRAAPSTGTPSSFANIMRIRSAGRGRLPVCVVRNPSILRMAIIVAAMLTRAGPAGRGATTEPRKRALLGDPPLAAHANASARQHYEKVFVMRAHERAIALLWSSRSPPTKRWLAPPVLERHLTVPTLYRIKGPTVLIHRSVRDQFWRE